MKISELIPSFDDAILNKNETNLFLIGQKIARIYSFNFFKKFNFTCDWELIADEVTINMLQVVKKTNWQKESNYYFGCIKTGIKFKYMHLLKDSKTVSLEAFSTNEYGEIFIDHLNLKPAYNTERSAAEETALEYVRKIIELADQFKTKKQVEEELGIDHKIFLFLCRKYEIQFCNGSLRFFLDAMKIYNIYLETGKDLYATKLIVKQQGITANNHGVKSNISWAEYYLDMWKNNKQVFINKLILPPNRTSVFEKI